MAARLNPHTRPRRCRNPPTFLASRPTAFHNRLQAWIHRGALAFGGVGQSWLSTRWPRSRTAAIKCNAPAHGWRVNKALHWHHPPLYVLIFAGLLVYAIIALVVQKSAKVSLGFCHVHKSQRNRTLLAGWLLFFVSLVAFFAAIAEGEASIAVVGVALLTAAVVLSLLGGRFIQVKKIDDEFVYLKGVHPRYLDEFPSV